MSSLLSFSLLAFGATLTLGAHQPRAMVSPVNRPLRSQLNDADNSEIPGGNAPSMMDSVIGEQDKWQRKIRQNLRHRAQLDAEFEILLAEQDEHNARERIQAEQSDERMLIKDQQIDELQRLIQQLSDEKQRSSEDSDRMKSEFVAQLAEQDARHRIQIEQSDHLRSVQVRSQHEVIESLQRELFKEAQEKEKSRKESARVKAELEAQLAEQKKRSESAIERFTKQEREKTRQVRELDTRLDAAMENVSELQREKQAAEKTHRELSEAKEAVQCRLTDSEQECERIRHEKAEEVRQMEDEIHVINDRLTAQKGIVTQLRSQLSKMAEQSADQQREMHGVITEIQKQLSDEKEQRQRADEESARLKSELETEQKKIHSLKMSRLSNEIEELKKSIRTVESKKQSKLQLLKNELKAKESERDALKSQRVIPFE